jgi:hypothetical protein
MASRSHTTAAAAPRWFDVLTTLSKAEGLRVLHPPAAAEVIGRTR